MAGLRERKKQQTRDSISAVATRLFVSRGFDATTIGDVAAAADVAKMTVTNYFPLKEDLVFDRRDVVARLLADAVRDRPRGVSVVEAAHAAYLAALDRHEPALGFLGADFARMVTASPALLARERDMFDAQEIALAEVLAARATSAGDLRPRLAAAQVSGVVRVLYGEARRRLLAGEPTTDIVRALRRAARTGFAAITVAPSVG